jgi:hypothetical protein
VGVTDPKDIFSNTDQQLCSNSDPAKIFGFGSAKLLCNLVLHACTVECFEPVKICMFYSFKRLCVPTYL